MYIEEVVIKVGNKWACNACGEEIGDTITCAKCGHEFKGNWVEIDLLYKSFENNKK